MKPSIVLFGCGQLGRRTASLIRDRYEVVFADNHKNGQYVDGIRVLSATTASLLLGEGIPFVVTIYNGDDARQQLTKMGVKKVRHFRDFYIENSDRLLPYACIDAEPIDEDACAKVYNLLADDKSRDTFVNLLSFLGQTTQWTVSAKDHDDPAEMYFPPFIKPLDDEVFVDCGAFDGDTVRQFLKVRGGKFKEIVAIDADPANFARLKEWRHTIDEESILLAQLAVGATDGKVSFSFHGDQGSHVGGDMEVDQVKLDSLFEHRFGTDRMPTFLKCDIEGAEVDAIEGARQTIRDHSPVLAICLYHRLSDLWKIPLLVHEINPGYELFIRKYAEDSFETVLYAVPTERVLFHE